jgi:CRP-like cAMP-binding protein
VLRKNAKIELVKSVPLFSHCSKKELAELASVADELDVGVGKALVREGETGREFCIIVEGEAEVRRGGRKLRTLGDGDFFGEIALISGGPRTATVTTTAPTRLLIVTDRAFKTLLADVPSLQTSVLKALGERMNDRAL